MSASSSPLWTKDFTILTLGTVISMLGNAVSGFAIGLMVLDYTKSVFLYSLFMVIYNLPKLIMPLLAGPVLDKISRKKIIWGLDFVSAGIYFFVWLALRADLFNYPLFAVMAAVVGSIDSVYQVAYDSLYPNLVAEGNFSKAYSISSMLYPLSAVMVPVAAYCYDHVGLAPLFLFNAISFFIAAVFETQIKAEEKHISADHRPVGLRQYAADFKEGISYIGAEKGLLAITAYFFVTTLASAGVGTLLLPYFKATPGLGVQNYTWVMGCALLGRLIGGGFHYVKKFKPEHKFSIALMVYLVITVLDATYLFLPVALMMVFQLAEGLLGVTSYNIRISATQAYVPDVRRARFNGAFAMLCNLGGIIGQLIAGAAGDFLPARGIVLALMGINMVAILAVMIPARKPVSAVYNREV